MGQIINNILGNFYDISIKHHESQLGFKKELLIIKSDELSQRNQKQRDKINLRYKHDLAKFESKAGIESDYIKTLIQELSEDIKEKAYWKRRILNQKIKRAKTEDKENLLKEKLQQLNDNEKSMIIDVKEKNLNAKPTKEDIALYETKKKELKEAKDAKLKEINERYEARLKTLHIKTNLALKKHQEKIEMYQAKLLKIEESSETNSDSVVLDKDIALSLRNLSMHFGGLKAVDDLSFDVKKGEIFGLIGPNGAGKTTVFNCITRFYKPTSGHMYFNNSNQKTVYLNEIKVHNIIKEGIVRTFQNVELVWELNILDNLLVAAHSAYRSNFFSHSVNSRLTKREEIIFKRRATKILEDLNLTPYTYGYPIGLPYGVLKKVELARTLMCNPELIILDEPAAGLNDSETKELANFIKTIKDEYNVTIFLVEHDMGLVMDICDTVCAISFGKKLAIGSPQVIQKSKVVQEAYLGGE